MWPKPGGLNIEMFEKEKELYGGSYSWSKLQLLSTKASVLTIFNEGLFDI